MEETVSGVDFRFRRHQLGERSKMRYTRMPQGSVHPKQGDDMVLTRLDRFYLPTDEANEDLLPSLQLRWDILPSTIAGAPWCQPRSGSPS